MASYDCLIDYIGLKGCSTSTPLSGLFINSLPGVQLKMLDQIADEQQVNFDGVWDDVQLRASQRLRNDAIAEFNKRYQLDNLQRSLDLGRIIDTTSTTASSTDYRGFTVELSLENSSFVDSNLQQLYLHKVSLYLPLAVNTTIKVFDIEQNIEIASKIVTGAAGWNEINFVTLYNPRRVFIAYDATNVNSVELDITKFPQKGNSYYSDCYYANMDNGTFLKIKGGTATIADPFTITQSNNTFGLSAIFSVQCTFEDLICNNINLFANALMYVQGAELMSELLNSDRLNEFTSYDRGDKEELQMQFEAQYRGGTITKGDNAISYPGELNQVIDSVRLDQSDNCIRCNEAIRFMSQTP